MGELAEDGERATMPWYGRLASSSAELEAFLLPNDHGAVGPRRFGRQRAGAFERGGGPWDRSDLLVVGESPEPVAGWKRWGRGTTPPGSLRQLLPSPSRLRCRRPGPGLHELEPLELGDGADQDFAVELDPRVRG